MPSDSKKRRDAQKKAAASQGRNKKKNGSAKEAATNGVSGEPVLYIQQLSVICFVFRCNFQLFQYVSLAINTCTCFLVLSNLFDFFRYLRNT